MPSSLTMEAQIARFRAKQAREREEMRLRMMQIDGGRRLAEPADSAPWVEWV
jgi:hypothetical protein